MFQSKTLPSTRKRIGVYIALIFIFSGPLDYLTTYYGVYVKETVQEANPLVQSAMNSGLFAEYIFSGSLLITVLLLVCYLIVDKFGNNEKLWIVFETLTLITLTASFLIIANNITVIFLQ